MLDPLLPLSMADVSIELEILSIAFAFRCLAAMSILSVHIKVRGFDGLGDLLLWTDMLYSLIRLYAPFSKAMALKRYQDVKQPQHPCSML